MSALTHLMGRIQREADFYNHSFSFEYEYKRCHKKYKLKVYVIKIHKTIHKINYEVTVMDYSEDVFRNKHHCVNPRVKVTTKEVCRNIFIRRLQAYYRTIK